MYKWIRQGIALLAALTLFSGCLPHFGPDKPPAMDQDGNKIFDDLDRLLEQVEPDEPVPVLVMMQDHRDTMRLTEMGDEVQVRYRYSVVPAVAASMTRAQVLKYAKEDYVQHIEHDAEVQVLMGTASQWFGATKARQDFAVTGDRDGAGYSAQDVVVAVIDTGIDANHIDLDGGKVIAWHDWVQNRTDPYDDNGHGTHVAGIIAGSGEGNSAYTGVAPGAALIGLKVLDVNGSGTLSNVTAAVDWAVANKATYNIKIISMSLGTSGSSDGTDTLSQAVNRAAEEGIIPVIAAGNSGPRSYTVGSPGAAVNAITIAFAWARKLRFTLRRSPTTGWAYVKTPVSAVNAIRRIGIDMISCLRPK
ncbi:MAG: S8 family serine peptidase [Bacillota bacterium]